MLYPQYKGVSIQNLLCCLYVKDCAIVCVMYVATCCLTFCIAKKLYSLNPSCISCLLLCIEGITFLLAHVALINFILAHLNIFFLCVLVSFFAAFWGPVATHYLLRCHFTISIPILLSHSPLAYVFLQVLNLTFYCV